MRFQGLTLPFASLVTKWSYQPPQSGLGRIKCPARSRYSAVSSLYVFTSSFVFLYSSLIFFLVVEGVIGQNQFSFPLLLCSTHVRSSAFLWFFLQVGENGAGKSTMLKLLMGDLAPVRGIRHAHR